MNAIGIFGNSPWRHFVGQCGLYQSLEKILLPKWVRPDESVVNCMAQRMLTLALKELLLTLQIFRRRFRARLHVQLFINRVQMAFDSVHTHAHLVGNFLV